MRHNKNGFRHESLHDAKSIQNILKAIQQGLSKGKLTFEDEDGVLDMRPAGLLHLKVSASQEEASSRVNIRISWQDDKPKARKKNIRVRSE